MQNEKPVVISPDYRDPSMTMAEFEQHNTAAKLAIAAQKEKESFEKRDLFDPLITLWCYISDKISSRRNGR